MTDSHFDLEDIWKADSQNLEVSRTALKDYWILNLYKRLPDLFEGLQRAVEQHLSSTPGIPFLRPDTSGKEVPAWDMFMRLYMLTSAYQQFIIATGHLFRGYITPVFGPMRRAIEGAGIAYLSKSKPKLGDLFQNRDRKNFKKQTSTEKILPENDPLTADLKNTINIASGQIHNNFLSFAGRLKQSLKVKDGKYHYNYEFAIHEVTKESFGFYLNICLWTLRAAERVALLLAASFDLPDCEWYQQHAGFKQELQRLYIVLEPIILGKEIDK